MKLLPVLFAVFFTACGQAYDLSATDFPTIDDTQDPSAPINNPLAPIDALCAGGKDLQTVFPTKNPVLAKTLPDTCRQGFEMNNLKRGTYAISSTAGARAGLKLEIDLATYLAPDSVRIIATLADGKEQVLLDTCRMQTATYNDPTRGKVRPPEDSIRDYRVPLPEGTRQLKFDFSGATSPTYIEVLGLCDFSLTAPDKLPADQWRAK